MIFYKFYIKDYQADTSHLDPIEDIAYRRMLDFIYLKELPLPLDLEKIGKLIRMRSHTDSIDYVLREFFEETPDGYINHRIADEIQQFYAKSQKARQSALARWQRHERTNVMRTQSERNANGMLLMTHDSEKEKDIVKTTSERNANASTKKSPKIPFTKIVELWNEVLPELPQPVKLTPARKANIRARWNDELPDLDSWRECFGHIRDSSFLMGKVEPINGRKRFTATLDWVVKPDNLVKLYEGRYDG